MVAKIKLLFMLFIFLSSGVVSAANLSLEGVYDESSGNIIVDVSMDGLVNDRVSLDFKMDYSAAAIKFIKAVYASNSVSSYSGSQAGSVGQVSGSAILNQISSNPVVRLYFGTTDPSTFHAVFSSIKFDDVEYGPREVPNLTKPVDDSDPVDPPIDDAEPPVTNSPSAPTDIKASGLNRAISVNWNHTNDGVIGFKAVAYRINRNGERSLPNPISSCEVYSDLGSCVIENVRNNKLYSVIVNAIYPNSIAMMSLPSNPVMPSSVNHGGICRRFFDLELKPVTSFSGPICRVGKPISFDSTGGFFPAWSCVGFGYGELQECTVFE